jgi:hypothetical protein
LTRTGPVCRDRTDARVVVPAIATDGTRQMFEMTLAGGAADCRQA